MNYTPDSFISNIFIHPKKDDTHRMILNLKPLNEFVDYHHFKMNTFRTALKLIRPGCFMASVDLKDAYYSIHIAEEDRKFLILNGKGNTTNSHVYSYLMACHLPQRFSRKSSNQFMHIYVLMDIHVWGISMIPFSLVRPFTCVNKI